MTLGRCSCEFVVFCTVHPRTVRACLADSPWLADCPRPLANHSADHLDRSGVFRLEATFVLRAVRALSSGQSAPSLADSPRQPGGQSDLYADSCLV
jgi:hypothetical protein